MTETTTTKPQWHMVSLSGGKDSTAMLLHMLELDMHVDEIIFCDTGLEFPQMYEHLDKVEQYIGRPITRLKPEHDFEYYLKDVPVPSKRKLATKYNMELPDKGYGMPTRRLRWCTTYLKDRPRKDYEKKLAEKYDVIHYVGLAADETDRLARKCNNRKDNRHPLVDWGWTEAQCLEYCYSLGFDWGGLYKDRNGLSCWCCPMQPNLELKILWRKFPDLWAKLQSYGDLTYWRDFHSDYRVEDYAKRFEFEDIWEAQGYECKGRAFYNALYEYMGGKWTEKIKPTKQLPRKKEGAESDDNTER